MGREILTNKFNLPESLVNAALRDDHVTAGTLSVTTLIDAPQVRYLRNKHDYEVDVTDKLYAMVGTAMHTILEKSDLEYSRKKAFIITAEALIQKGREFEGTATEKANQLKAVAKYLFELIPVLFPETAGRYVYEITTSIDIGNGYILSGTFDLFDKQTGILYDYKYCSTYQYMYPEARKKWDEQTNIYAYMLVTIHGYTVMGIRIIAMFRNWSKFELIKNRQNYPPRQTIEIAVGFRPLEKISALIEKHKQRHLLADQGNVPECTGEERWATADEYAVMSVGGKKARVKLPSAATAQIWIDDNKHKIPNLYIDVRRGVSKRCEEYCAVSKVCPQFKREKESLKQEEVDDKVIENLGEFAGINRGLRE
jgi:hypothetical protein